MCQVVPFICFLMRYLKALNDLDFEVTLRNTEKSLVSYWNMTWQIRKWTEKENIYCWIANVGVNLALMAEVCFLVVNIVSYSVSLISSKCCCAATTKDSVVNSTVHESFCTKLHIIDNRATNPRYTMLATMFEVLKFQNSGWSTFTVCLFMFYSSDCDRK